MAKQQDGADITAGIQAELNNLIACNAASTSTAANRGNATMANSMIKTTAAGMAASTINSNTVMTVNAPNTILMPSSSQTRTIASSASMPAGATQYITIPAGTDASKVVQNLAKRTLPPGSSQGQMVTKVIITRNPDTKLPMSSAATHGTPTMIKTADGRQLLTTGSPIKFVTVSSGAGLPTKNVIYASSPNKNLKMPIMPLKSPTKVVTLKAAPTTPKKIAPAPQQMLMSIGGGSPKSVLVSGTGATRTIQVISTAGQVLSNVPITIQSNAGGAQTMVKTATATTLSGAGTSHVQQIQVPGSKFPYMRLVTVTAGTTTTTQARPIAQAPMAKTIAPRPTPAITGVQTTTQPQQIKIAIPQVNRSIASTSQHRLIMPANLANTNMKIVSAGAAGQKFAHLPPGTTLLTTAGGGMIPVAMLPQSYMAQVPQTQIRAVNQTNFVPIASNQATPQVAQIQQQIVAPPPPKHAMNGRAPLPDQSGGRPRKPCNCTKSQCLKLYCDCFANGEFCANCNCNNCHNNLENEDDRAKAIKACLERNPTAFHPKIGKGRNGQTDRRHTKGCNCKRSGCLKNYCECYEAKILCGATCKCVGCKNFEESPERKTLMHLADAAEVRVNQQTAAKTKLSSQIQDYPVRPQEVNDSGERLPFSFITNEVAEATCQCMLAQAEEIERNGGSPILAERMILEEFGRCLLQVIHSASRTRGSIVK